MNMQLRTISDTIMFIRNELSGLYPPEEVNSMAMIILEHVSGYERPFLHAHPHTKIPNSAYLQIQDIVFQLKSYRPLQYILGETEFYGLKIKVSESVLIPRPETEELADLIIRETKNKRCTILDIGTGSGCIAIALANALPKCLVKGIDISEEALELARQNAAENEVSENTFFIKADILKQLSFEQQFDIIVSNPPYVRESEKTAMHPNVLEHEPGTALFVSDEDPLLFYRAIAKGADKWLKPDGKIYLEINEALGKETADLFIQYGFSNSKIVKDINGRNRMVTAAKQ